MPATRPSFHDHDMLDTSIPRRKPRWLSPSSPAITIAITTTRRPRTVIGTAIDSNPSPGLATPIPWGMAPHNLTETSHDLESECKVGLPLSEDRTVWPSKSVRLGEAGSEEDYLGYDSDSRIASRGAVRRIMDARGKTQICFSTVAGSEPAVGAQAAAPLLLYLIIVRGGIPGTMLRLGQKSSSLGRSAENTFQFHDSTVSRRHAVLSIDPPGAAWLMDLGSTNGTFVNGRRIAAQTPVQVGDGSRIQLGSSTLLKYLKLDPCEEGFQRELYERSVRDNLTGLYNRGYFLSQLGPLAELNSMCELGLA